MRKEISCRVVSTFCQDVELTEDEFEMLDMMLDEGSGISMYIKDENGKLCTNPAFDLLSDKIDFDNPSDWVFEDVDIDDSENNDE